MPCRLLLLGSSRGKVSCCDGLLFMQTLWELLTWSLLHATATSWSLLSPSAWNPSNSLYILPIFEYLFELEILDSVCYCWKVFMGTKIKTRIIQNWASHSESLGCLFLFWKCSARVWNTLSKISILSTIHGDQLYRDTSKPENHIIV